MAFSTKSVANQLMGLGVAARVSGLRDEVVDGEIDLGGGYTVQVGGRYLALCQSEGEGDDFSIASGPDRRAVAELLRDIAAVPSLATPKLVAFLADLDASSGN